MEIDELIIEFLDKFSQERDMPPNKRNVYRHTLDKFKETISRGKIEANRAKDFLDKENNFIIESFLGFLKTKEKYLPRLIVCNIHTFAKEIFSRPVTAKDYDERIQSQSLQFQIDNYYQPKEFWARNRIDNVLNLLNPHTGEFILDIGCGVGTFSYRVALARGRAVGIDYSLESLRIARELIGKFGVSKNVNFIVANATQLPFKARIFDKIVCADFIEHIGLSDKALLVDEMRRIIKENGLIIISTPNSLRERLGCIKRWLLCFLQRKPIIETRLHFGLTNRFGFEKLLSQNKFSFKRYYFDESRPLLAKLPLLKEILSLRILWKVWK
jgi:ubiquinone/menaquinone biosynthesis C-methylase UbiE